jgi:nucleotide-binding universal stress UspA family protein
MSAMLKSAILLVCNSEQEAQMYSNIVIPVSFEEGRDISKASEVAKALAAPDARITFIHITESVPTYVADFIPPDAWEARKAEAQRRINDLAEAVDGATGIVVDGYSGRTITDWSKEHGADLIVIASHQPQMSDIFLGSTAAWVVRHAECPVHVIR